ASATTSLPSVSPRFRFASFSVFRFGEAVFTETRQKPQEEKTGFVTIFCRKPRETQVLLVKFSSPYA
ncbi:hypothetical protein, partial [Fuscibacter oryzae]|uniref:hypothetical protein n=1 Tax=Fuscibacter oryzae TaxID=2803939 RepID=UPI001F3E6228